MLSRKLTRGRLGLECVFFFSVLVAFISICGAQEYPTRSIDMVQPFAAGGSADLFFRNIVAPFGAKLKVSVSIVNRPGGGGVVGSSFVANAKPDGYTLLAVEWITLLMTQAAMPKTSPYDVLKSFTPIAHCASEPLLLVVRSDLGINTMEDLISYAKKNPGKLLAGVSGPASQNRTDLELLKAAAGINIRHLLCTGGGGDVLIKMLGGHVDMSFSTIPVAGAHIKAGKLRALATLSAERTIEFPDVPTTKEKGYPQVNLTMAYGLFGPKGLSPQIVEKLSSTMKATLTAPEMLANLKGRGYFVDFSPWDQFSERVPKDFRSYADFAAKAGLIQEEQK
jgi:tripartite-type tricarboxylate transporter receptor subunit TctC